MEMALTFNDVQFDIVDHNGEPWVRLSQIATALGYGLGGSQTDTPLRMLYNRHADEFTPSMTSLIKLPTAGGEQETRIFSLRGCHLLAMFARTPIAKEFRKWVLDVLDRLGKADQKPIDESSTERLSHAEHAIVASLIKAITDRHEPQFQRSANMRVWRALQKEFGVTSYKLLPKSKMPEVCYWLANYEPESRRQDSHIGAKENGIDPAMTSDLREILAGIYEMHKQCDTYINHIYAYIGSNVIRMNADIHKQNLFHALVHLKRTSMDGLHMAKDSLLTLWNLGKGVSFI